MPDKPSTVSEATLKKLETLEKLLKSEKPEKFEHKEKPEKFEHEERLEKAPLLENIVEFVPGRDVRVHVVDDEVYATEIVSRTREDAMSTKHIGTPMRIQAMKGSAAEKRYYRASGLPGASWAMPKAIANGVSPAPLEDLIFHGGKLVPKMQFKNVYLGSSKDWVPADMASIDAAITLAMQDRRLNAIMGQYFHRAALSCDPLPSTIRNDPKPARLDEQAVQDAVKAFLADGTVAEKDLDVTIFNLILPRGSILAIDDTDSLQGLGGYHGSVHATSPSQGQKVTLYYSANVYSETLPNGRTNGIPAFDESWKDVVGTLYHELNEFRTDADVKDAIDSQQNDFLGWMSRSGRECGDEPIAAADSLDSVFKELLLAAAPKPVPVQLMYSNRVHGPEDP